MDSVIVSKGSNDLGVVISPSMFTKGHVYQPLDEETLPSPRYRQWPVTEEQWRAEHAGYEGNDLYSEPRLVLVEWDDPEETPSDRIARLNREAVEAAAQPGSNIPFRRPARDDEHDVVTTVLRWKEGSPWRWEEATVYQRTGLDTVLVRYADGHTQGALFKEIRATREEWRAIEQMPTITTIND